MHSSLTPFAFGDTLVRVHQDEQGNPWFVAKDVCQVLELENVTVAIGGLDEDEKNTLRIAEGIRGNPNVNIISESGLYSLIFRSRKPEARAFRKWVTSEVLPAIRRQGCYQKPPAPASIPAASLPALPELAGLGLKRSLRVQLMSMAVQIAKGDGSGSEAEVLERYARLCAVVAGPEGIADASRKMACPVTGLTDYALFQEWHSGHAEESTGGPVRSQELYQSFKAFSRDRGIVSPPSQKWFGSQLTNRYYKRKRLGHYYYFGVTLKKKPDKGFVSL